MKKVANKSYMIALLEGSCIIPIKKDKNGKIIIGTPRSLGPNEVIIKDEELYGKPKPRTKS